jgi:hypothetical protein
MKMAVGGHLLKVSLILFSLLGMSGCQTEIQSQVFQLETGMGKMTIKLLGQNKQLEAQVYAALKSTCNASPLQLTHVQQDAFIGFDLLCTDSAFAFPKTKSTIKHCRGALFLLPDRSQNKCYIVQGKPITGGALQAIASDTKQVYSASDQAKYLKFGGMPELDGRGYPIGFVVDGLEVIDKLAALPTNKEMHPIQDFMVGWSEWRPK